MIFGQWNWPLSKDHNDHCAKTFEKQKNILTKFINITIKTIKFFERYNLTYAYSFNVEFTNKQMIKVANLVIVSLIFSKFKLEK